MIHRTFGPAAESVRAERAIPVNLEAAGGLGQRHDRFQTAVHDGRAGVSSVVSRSDDTI